jgi:hypothetical protein
MPPAPHEYHGIPAITGFLRASMGFRGNRRVSLVPTRANTQPAFSSYLAESDATAAHPAGLIVLTLTGDRIAATTRFHTNQLLPHLGATRKRVTATLPPRGALLCGSTRRYSGRLLREVTVVNATRAAHLSSMRRPRLGGSVPRRHGCPPFAADNHPDAASGYQYATENERVNADLLLIRLPRLVRQRVAFAIRAGGTLHHFRCA